MIRVPESTWSQPNTSDKFGNLAATKNINFDEKGYAKLSPRTVQVGSEAINSNFGVPLAVGKYGAGNYLIATSDSNFTATLDATSLTVSEDNGTSNPSLTNRSHATFWQALWLASSTTEVRSRNISGGNGATWDQRITGLDANSRHVLRVFENRQTLCVSDGNVVKQYNTSFVNTTNLTIPSDFEVVGMAYNANKLGIITRLGDNTEGQNREAFFFVWDGATSAANAGVGLGALSGVAICPYKSSFAVLTQAGQLLYWNGGGFEVLGTLPFYFTNRIWGDLLNQEGLGDIMVADGDRIYINLGLELQAFGRTEERLLTQQPSGVWCYDPSVKLYHRLSGSTSKAYMLTVSDVDTATGVITVSSGTIPETGNPVRYTSASSTIGGLTQKYDYFVIKIDSTTFKLAETKADAIAGTAITLTSEGTSSFFWAYELNDYGTSYSDVSGAVTLTRTNDLHVGSFLFGGAYDDTTLTAQDALCATVPYLENRGYIVTPKIFPSQAEGTVNKLVIKHRPLGENDSITVKCRNKEVLGLPISTTGNVNGAGTSGTWSNEDHVVFATGDFSAAQTFLESGGEIEMEIVSGAGGGTLVKVTHIEPRSATSWKIVLAESVLGAAEDRKCHFVLDHWEYLHTVDQSTALPGDYFEVSVPRQGKWSQFKIELRGHETTIEDILLPNSTLTSSNS